MSYKIVGVSVDWMDQYANRPTWEIVFENEAGEQANWKNPSRNEVIYEKRGSLVLGFTGSMAHFNSVVKDHKMGGYCESKFNFKLTDGTTLENYGAWSGRSGLINALFEDHVVECVARPADGCGMSTAVKVADLVEFLKNHSYLGIGVRKVSRFGGEIYYEPTKDGKVKWEGEDRLYDVTLLETLV